MELKTKNRNKNIKNLYFPILVKDYGILFVEFARKKKHENRNELEFLLDGMLRQGAITPSEYTQLYIYY